MVRTFLSIGAIGAGIAGATSGSAAPDASVPDAAWVEFFENRIRPVLAEHCYRCHSAEAEKLEGGLQVDHRDHLLAGGEAGPAIRPGDAAGSRLLEAIRYGNPDLQMPPKDRLAESVVADFERWIAAGAPWPDEPVPDRHGEAEEESFDLEGRRAEHWSWRPVKKPAPPAVEEESWPRKPLDRFVLARLDGEGLRPAREAARRDWLRRVHFDLVGLPPEPAEIEAFLADDSPDAHRRVVDELLASPHFGEKWARHWMDLVRYADTYGHEFDYPIRHAHEYRDYLIRAWNADVPYDLLVKEHIAGDLLEEPRRHPERDYDESILGTAFWYFHEATHAPTDVLGNEADIMANQVDVFGKSFLGLTVSCARCHDHKFDAISTADYYALTAYLHSSARQEHVMDPGRERERTREQQEKWKTRADALLVASRQEGGQPAKAGAPTGNGGAASGREGGARQSGHPLPEDFAAGRIPPGWSTTGFAFAGGGAQPGIRFDESEPLTVPGTVDSGVYGAARVGTLRSPTFPIETGHLHVRLRAEGATVRLVIDNYQMAQFSALLFKGTHREGIDTEGEFRWITLGKDLAKYRGHRAYLEIIDPGDGAVVVDEVRFSPEAAPPQASPPDASPPGADVEGPGSPTAEPPPPEVMEFVRKGQRLVGQLGAPRRAVAMAAGTPEAAHVYVRGSHRQLGEEVPRRFLEALGGREGDRLTLAREVASADNPLTSRVIVNRLWHHLFGRGLVRTVDDFGPMGTEPTHPELLDWLAADFVENGWSLKRTIRRIVLSSTYRQSVRPHPGLSRDRLEEVDPSNELLSHMPVKRLTGEAIRDSILAVSGRLDPEMFGTPVPTHRTPFMTGRGGRKSGPRDGDGRRSIYGAVYRNFLSPFLLTFDVPSPFGPKGRRSVSNVPAQALVLMNDPFVVEQSRVWADRVLSGDEPRGERIERMMLAALGRPPSGSERADLASFLKSHEAGADSREAWADLAHVLFNAKEFIFLN